jgi:hypothetical protein
MTCETPLIRAILSRTLILSSWAHTRLRDTKKAGGPWKGARLFHVWPLPKQLGATGTIYAV